MSDTQQGPGWWQASDGKWYPPPSPASTPFPAQPIYAPAAQSSNGCLIAFLVVTVLIVVGGIVTVIVSALVVDEAVDQAVDDLGNERIEEAQDVEVIDCNTDDANVMLAELEVTNHSSEPSTYFIEVVFETRDGRRQLSSAPATVNELRPGQSTRVRALSLTERPAEGGFTCDVADVQRLAS